MAEPRFRPRHEFAPKCGVVDRRSSRLQTAPSDEPAPSFPRQSFRPVLLGGRHKYLALGVVSAFDERQKPAASLQVKLSHDIVDEEHRRGSIDAGEVFGLGHLESNRGGPFLAFAAELRGGAVAFK